MGHLCPDRMVYVNKLNKLVTLTVGNHVSLSDITQKKLNNYSSV